MSLNSIPIALEKDLDLGKLCSTGSILHINEDYNNDYSELETNEVRKLDYIGKPVNSFEELEKELTTLDECGLVKKKILEVGGGMPLNKGCTVSVAYSGYWEGESEPFDYTNSYKPQVVNLNDNGLLPGIQTAIESMLVGEMAVFLLSHEVMYGELGVPPRIKPKAKCAFYIKIIKSIITPKDGEIDFLEPNIFARVYREVKLLYVSGVTLHKTKNYSVAIQVFKKGINMLHRCRLADEAEECKQEKLLTKLYLNLAVCSNDIKAPLKACIACNELNRLNQLWNNAKALYQNAKALRMIGEFDEAKKKLNRAMKLAPGNEKIVAELELLEHIRHSCDQNKLIGNKIIDTPLNTPSDSFKSEVDNLIKSFKDNANLCKLPLLGGLNGAEIEYVKEACLRENLFCSQIQKKYLLDKDEENSSLETKLDLFQC